MLLEIAELLVEVLTAEGDIFCCQEYKTARSERPDIIVKDEIVYIEQYPSYAKAEDVVYVDSGWQFYKQLLIYNGLYIHSSAIALDNRAYLFSGPCGMGKSTHTRLWQQVFGEAVQVINDDKPALRRLDGQWFAYGTPWCGKDHINVNRKVPLQGICFLKRGEENRIRRLSPLEATAAILTQTMRKFKQVEYLDLLLSHVDKLVREIPIYEMECLPNEEAALLSYNTMRPRD